MASYAAFLGHQPRLSIAELAAVVADFSFTRILSPLEYSASGSRNILLFASNQTLTVTSLQKLGGTIAIARRITEADISLEDVPQLLANEVQDVKGKVVFSLRTSGLSPKKVRELLRRSKEMLRRKGKTARYIGSERKPAASILLHEQGLLNGKRGCELVILIGTDLLWVGRTVAAQDTESYAKRDMRKPVRDTRTGLLPPKLAQILLNFGAWLAANAQRQAVRDTQGGSSPLSASRFPLTVLDPFCGTGVIAMEALLRGWHVLASDVSQRAVNGCIKNLEWLRKEETILKKDVASSVWKQDATTPFALKRKPDAIVTETMLGPPLLKRAPIREAERWRRENEELQTAFLRNVSQSFPGVPAVCVWPVWFTSKGMVRLEKVFGELPAAGYQAILPPGVESDFPDRSTLLYRRPDQFVGREIVILRTRRN